MRAAAASAVKMPLAPIGVGELGGVEDGQGQVAAVAELGDGDALFGGQDSGSAVAEDVVHGRRRRWR